MANLKILITDDDADDREFIKDAFKAIGAECICLEFEDGKQLIEYLKLSTNLTELVIIIDLNMPILGGYDTIKIIKDEPQYNSIPIVIMTTSSSSTDKKKCQEFGAIDYFVKPLVLTEYEDIAKEIITTYSS